MARMSQIAVPEALSVVGFENSPFSRQTWPHLTTIEQPNFTIAATAAEMVIDMMQDKDGKQVKSQGFRLDLVIRESACAPSA